jgi:hypothetical protein
MRGSHSNQEDLDLMRVRQAVVPSLFGIISLFLIARILWLSPDHANLTRDIFLAIAIGLSGIVIWFANRSLYLKSATMLVGAAASAIKSFTGADGKPWAVVIYAVLSFWFVGESIAAIGGIVKQKKAASGSLREAGPDSTA